MEKGITDVLTTRLRVITTVKSPATPAFAVGDRVSFDDLVAIAKWSTISNRAVSIDSGETYREQMLNQCEQKALYMIAAAASLLSMNPLQWHVNASCESWYSGRNHQIENVLSARNTRQADPWLYRRVRDAPCYTKRQPTQERAHAPSLVVAQELFRMPRSWWPLRMP